MEILTNFLNFFTALATSRSEAVSACFLQLFLALHGHDILPRGKYWVFCGEITKHDVLYVLYTQLYPDVRWNRLFLRPSLILLLFLHDFTLQSKRVNVVEIIELIHF